MSLPEPGVGVRAGRASSRREACNSGKQEFLSSVDIQGTEDAWVERPGHL